ncbi:hypothetical protein V8C37DRAFT_403323 [Trichoderma ceciliae]
MASMSKMVHVLVLPIKFLVMVLCVLGLHLCTSGILGNAILLINIGLHVWCQWDYLVSELIESLFDAWIHTYLLLLGVEVAKYLIWVAGILFRGQELKQHAYEPMVITWLWLFERGVKRISGMEMNEEKYDE